MGAPKQKWTSEEEAALKAGIQKYGIGKWSTILKDPEFSTVLRSRSNVDLKDKWRNLNCMANGLGSRHRARVSIKSSQLITKQDEDTTSSSMVVYKDMEVLGITSLAASNEISQDAISKKKISRLDDVILEAITKLKEPRGSSRPAINQYIEDNYSAPPELERTLAANLKILTENGRLIKVKNQYRIAPKLITFGAEEEAKLLVENGGGAKKDPFQAERSGVVLLSKAKIDAELEKMKSMSAEEAAAAAARAVAEAEAAIAEAEAAAREAEEAEADAEAAQCFADAAQKALNYQAIRV
ncbi:telomere repeat-binding factor 2-like isoform X3 [Salvia miltiorrhiza]|nr:telomere repeat-binding factor 2-like isoform X3 [Salvia miltiorrhiza]XP_057784444.1 telomere repeat-binding factor 2-like isoform X3 [Salvia miltiorrhiza]